MDWLGLSRSMIKGGGRLFRKQKQVRYEVFLGINLFFSSWDWDVWKVDVWEKGTSRASYTNFFFCAKSMQGKLQGEQAPADPREERGALLEGEKKVGKGAKENRTGEFGFPILHQKTSKWKKKNNKRKGTRRSDQPVCRAAMLQDIPCYRNLLFFFFELIATSEYQSSDSTKWRIRARLNKRLSFERATP
jgi:hypothetical protein